MSSLLGGFAGVGGGSIGRAAVDLVLNSTAYNEQLAATEAKTASSTKAMQGGFSGFQQSVKSSFSGAQVAMVGFGAIAAVAIGKAVGATQEWAAEVRTLQRVTGDSAENTSKLAAAGHLLNLSTEKLNTGFGILDKNIINNSANLTKYGVKLQDANGNTLPFLDILGNLSDKFATLQAGPQQAAFAMNVFGRSGKELIPVLARGSEGLQELYDKAQAAGLVMSQDTLDASKELGIAQRELGDAVKGAAIQLGTSFLPVLTLVADGLTKLVELIQVIPGPVLAIGTGFVTLAAAVLLASKAWTVLNASLKTNADLLTGTVPLIAAIGATIAIVSGQISDAHIDFKKLSDDLKINAQLLQFFADKMNLAGSAFENHSFAGFVASLDGIGDNLKSLTDALNPALTEMTKLGLAEGDQTQVLGQLQPLVDGSAESIATFAGEAQGAADTIQELSRKFANGKISFDVFQQNLQAIGVSIPSTMVIANNAVDRFGQHIDEAGHKVRNFAGLTSNQLDDFKSSVVDNIRQTFGTIESFDNHWRLSGQKVENATQQMASAIKRFNNDLAKLNALPIGDKIKQFLVEQGPGAVDAFVHANAAGRASIVHNIQDINAGFDTTQGKVRKLTSSTDDLHNSLNKLNGTAANIQINAAVRVTAQDPALQAAVAEAIREQLNRAGV